MLAKLGCTYVVVGHSERREVHGEDDALVNSKVQAAFRHGIVPDPVRRRGAGGPRGRARTSSTPPRSSPPRWPGSSAEQAQTLVIAYEPVWAIGTGRVASAADAQEVCAALRRGGGRDLRRGGRGRRCGVLYGGSVKANNVGEIVEQPDVDGALVGGASLDADEFAQLCAIAAGGPLP